MKHAAVLSIAIICTITSAGAFADQIIYVDAGALGSNDGSSWQDAYTYLHDALADANSLPNPPEIWVAQGIYRPDRSTAARGDLDRCTPTTCVLALVSLGGTLSVAGAPSYQFWAAR